MQPVSTFLFPAEEGKMTIQRMAEHSQNLVIEHRQACKDEEEFELNTRDIEHWSPEGILKLCDYADKFEAEHVVINVRAIARLLAPKAKTVKFIVNEGFMKGSALTVALSGKESNSEDGLDKEEDIIDQTGNM